MNDKEEYAEYDVTECPDCGEEVELSASYLYGDDADGNRGEVRRDIDEDHVCLLTEEERLLSNEYLQERADARRELKENR